MLVLVYSIITILLNYLNQVDFGHCLPLCEGGKFKGFYAPDMEIVFLFVDDKYIRLSRDQFFEKGYIEKLDYQKDYKDVRTIRNLNESHLSLTNLAYVKPVFYVFGPSDAQITLNNQSFGLLFENDELEVIGKYEDHWDCFLYMTFLLGYHESVSFIFMPDRLIQETKMSNQNESHSLYEHKYDDIFNGSIHRISAIGFFFDKKTNDKNSSKYSKRAVYEVYLFSEDGSTFKFNFNESIYFSNMLSHIKSFRPTNEHNFLSCQKKNQSLDLQPSIVKMIIIIAIIGLLFQSNAI